MNEIIKFDSGIKKYCIENENGTVVAELLINSKDNSLYDKFLSLMENVKNIQAESNKKIADFGLESVDSITSDDMKKLLEVNKKAIEALIEETEKMFGEGLIRRIYADNYRLNPDFLPGLESLFEFYEQILPIVEGIFRQKHAKYSPAKRGKANG